MATFRDESKASLLSSKSGGKNECMCVVCTCGLHKCPSRDTTRYDPEMQSEYGERYPEWPVQRRALHKPPPPEKPEGPMQNDTTYRVDFGKKSMPRRMLMKPPVRNDDSGPFMDETTYKLNYWDKSKEMKPAKRADKPHKMDTGPFYKETTYGVDYNTHKALPKRCPAEKHGSALGASGARFEDETTYRQGFKNWGVKKPQRAGPVRNLEPPAKFDTDSTYNIDFVRPPPVRRCPVLLRGKPSNLVDNHLCY